MSKRSRNQSLSEEIEGRVYCTKCRWQKGKYFEHEYNGRYTMVRFRCLKCHHIIVHYELTTKVKEYFDNAK